jgi:hypothetical protein
VFAVLAAWVGPRTKAEILDRLGGQVPVGAVRDAADAHVAVPEMLVELDHPGTGRTYAVAG